MGFKAGIRLFCCVGIAGTIVELSFPKLLGLFLKGVDPPLIIFTPLIVRGFRYKN